MERIQLRPAAAEDFDFCLEVRDRAFRAYVEEITTWDPELERRAMEDRFASGSVQIIALDGNKWGFLNADVIDASLRLQNLMILPEHQSQGVGAYVVRHLRSQPLPVKLRVLKHNVRAIAFYQRHGFDLESESPTHFHLAAPGGLLEDGSVEET